MLFYRLFFAQGVFATVCAPKSKADRYHDQHSLHSSGEKTKKRKAAAFSGDNFMPYRPKDYQSEQG